MYIDLKQLQKLHFSFTAVAPWHIGLELNAYAPYPPAGQFRLPTNIEKRSRLMFIPIFQVPIKLHTVNFHRVQGIYRSIYNPK